MLCAIVQSVAGGFVAHKPAPRARSARSEAILRRVRARVPLEDRAHDRSQPLRPYVDQADRDALRHFYQCTQKFAGDCMSDICIDVFRE